MSSVKKILTISFSFFAVLFIALIQGCSDNPNQTSFMTDDEYIRNTAINTAFSSDAGDDENLFSSEVFDFDSEGPVFDNDGDFDVPIDSIVRWGRIITGTNHDVNITTFGDTLKIADVTRTCMGNFIIIGYVNGIRDSIVKQFTQEQKRMISFKRVDRRPNPRFNWRVYQYSAIDGETKTPETGKQNIIMNRIEIYVNNNLVLTLNGPDFTTNIFTSRFFGGTGLFIANRNDAVKIKVYLTSNQTDPDIVSFHWPRNSFGYHREPFVMTSQTPNGNNFDRTFEKTYHIYSQHGQGIFNGFISSNTRNSLYDNSPSLFSSTYMGMPYRVRQ